MTGTLAVVPRHSAEENLRPSPLDPPAFLHWVCGGWGRTALLLALVALPPALADWGVRAAAGLGSEELARAALERQLAAEGLSVGSLSEAELAQARFTMTLLRWTFDNRVWLGTASGLVGILGLATILYMAFAFVQSSTSWHRAVVVTAYAWLVVVLLRVGLLVLVALLRPPTVDDYVAGAIVEASAALFYQDGASVPLRALLEGLDTLRLLGLTLIACYWPVVSRNDSLSPALSFTVVMGLYAAYLAVRVAASALLGL